MIQNEWQPKDFDRIIANFAISTVPADGLAPWGARTSVGTVMTKFGSHLSLYIHIGLALQGLKKWKHSGFILNCMIGYSNSYTYIALHIPIQNSESCPQSEGWIWKQGFLRVFLVAHQRKTSTWTGDCILSHWQLCCVTVDCFTHVQCESKFPDRICNTTDRILFILFHFQMTHNKKVMLCLCEL